MRKADNLPPSCAVVTKSRNLNFLEPSGSLRAYNGTVSLRCVCARACVYPHPISTLKVLADSTICNVKIRPFRLNRVVSLHVSAIF